MAEYRPVELSIRVIDDSGDTTSNSDMVLVAKIIADQIEDGYTSGKFADIAWDLNGTWTEPHNDTEDE